MPNTKDMKCSCGKIAKHTYTNIEGYRVKAWKCKTCGEEYLDSADAEFLLLLKKMKKKPLTAKVGVLGGSYIIRIPKEIVEFMGIERGEEAKIALVGPHEILVSVEE